jgi:hypothetical protein
MLKMFHEMNKKYAHAVEPQSESGSKAEEFWQRGYSTVLEMHNQRELQVLFVG